MRHIYLATTIDMSRTSAGMRNDGNNSSSNKAATKRVHERAGIMSRFESGRTVVGNLTITVGIQAMLLDIALDKTG